LTLVALKEGRLEDAKKTLIGIVASDSYFEGQAKELLEEIR